MNIIRLALNMTKYEIRTRVWGIMVAAIALAVTFLTLFYFYTERIELAIQRESSKLLGGDLVVISNNPLAADWKKQAVDDGLKTAEVVTVQTMMRHGDNMQLVNLQAVSQTYPLVGTYQLNLKPYEILVEPRVLTQMKLKTGNQVSIGDANYKINHVITSDVDTLTTGFALAPRVMMQLGDLAKANIILPGSRVEYRLLITGNKSQLNKFANWLRPQVKHGVRLMDVTAEEFILSNTVNKLIIIFQTILIFILLLSASTIVVSAQQYVKNHYQTAALWRTLGASQRQICFIFTSELLITAVIGSVIGIMIAYLLQFPIDSVIYSATSRQLPAAGSLPVFYGILAGAALLAVTTWRPIYHLVTTSPVILFHEENNQSAMFRFAILIDVLAALIYLFAFTGFSLFSFFILDVIIFSAAILYILNHYLFMALRRILPSVNFTLRRAIYNIIQYPETTALQIITFTLIATLFACILLMQNRLLADVSATWQGDKPNYFIYNISPDDLPALKQMLQTNKIKQEVFYPLLRARLVAVDNQDLSARKGIDYTHNALHRELNLTAETSFPSDNKVINGSDDMTIEKDGISIEKTLAEALKVNLGDTLSFQTGDATITGKIINIRTVVWQSFHPNFYVILHPDLIKGFAAPYLSSLYVLSEQKAIIASLIQRFPNMVVIDFSELLKQVQEIVNYFVNILYYLLLAISLSASVFLVSVINASAEERKVTKRLLIVLGARNTCLNMAAFVQWSFIFILVGVLAVCFSGCIYYFGLLRRFL